MGSGDLAAGPISTRPTADTFMRGLAGAELIDKVDFPLFVADLVAGVFQSKLNASIEQKQAYGDLVNSVAKTTGGFRSPRAGRFAISTGTRRDVLLHLPIPGPEQPVDHVDDAVVGYFSVRNDGPSAHEHALADALDTKRHVGECREVDALQADWSHEFGGHDVMQDQIGKQLGGGFRKENALEQEGRAFVDHGLIRWDEQGQGSRPLEAL